MTTTLNLDILTLKVGAHDGPDDGACLLEAASMLAEEPFSDSPICVSVVLAEFGRQLNDRLPDEKRQQLKPYIPQLLGTRGDGQDERRSLLALDWLVRTYLPTWLRLVPTLTAQADLLTAHMPIVGLEEAASIGPIVREAKSQADAAWAAARAAAGDAARAAARAAARDAAGSAARAAAWAAAGSAARAAAWAAAWDAAGSAAWDAAGSAAGAALAPTVSTLQDSAIALLGAMIQPTSI